MDEKSEDLSRIGAGGRRPNATEVPNIAQVAWALWLASCTFSVVVVPDLKKVSLIKKKPSKAHQKIWPSIFSDHFEERLRELKRDILVYLYVETKRAITGAGYTYPRFHTSSSEDFVSRLEMHLSRFGLEDCLYKSAPMKLFYKPYNVVSKADQYWIHLIVRTLIRIDNRDRSKQKTTEQYVEDGGSQTIPVIRQTGGGVHRACWFATQYPKAGYDLMGPEPLYALWLKYKSISNVLYACEVHGIHIESLKKSRLGRPLSNAAAKAGSIAKLASTTGLRLKSINPNGVKKGVPVVNGVIFDPTSSMLYEIPLCLEVFENGDNLEEPLLLNDDVLNSKIYVSSLRKDALL